MVLPDQAAAFGPLVYLLILAIAIMGTALAALVAMILKKLFALVQANTQAFSENTTAVESLIRSVDQMNAHLVQPPPNGNHNHLRRAGGG